jgi:hypothetical protein
MDEIASCLLVEKGEWIHWFSPKRGKKIIKANSILCKVVVVVVVVVGNGNGFNSSKAKLAFVG